MFTFKKFMGLLLAVGLVAQGARALEFALPEAGDSVVGAIKDVIVQKPSTLAQIGKFYDIGYSEMSAANADLPTQGLLPRGTHVRIPAQFILPSTRVGLVVNLADLRVYYFPENSAVVDTFPLAAGRQGWVTPLINSSVMNKAANPSWTVPASIMAESLHKGKKLKPFYASDDPENPLGHYALYLAEPGLRLHGTLATYSIGRRASHGCMRLWDEDIEWLYNHVPIGTPVLITHVEDKVGWQNHVLYLQAQVPFVEYHDAHTLQQQIDQATANHPATIDWQKVAEVSDQQEGIPTAIGYDASLTTLPVLST